MTRREDVDRFYELMQELEKRTGGKRTLNNCSGRMGWPHRGIYFFFEDGEYRNNGDLRIVRVGTHALKIGSGTSLWNRLSQHQGTLSGRHPGGGNHRGSIFRLHVGTAIISKDNLSVPTWSKGSTAKGAIRESEYSVEKKVSQYIGAMPFLWLGVNDEPGPESMRGYIERNSIALLSNYNNQESIDKQSEEWLGNYAWREKVNISGLWNVKHVDDVYDPKFLDVLEKYVEEM